MTQKSKLVAPDVVFNNLNAELSSLATSFATSLNAGVALVEGNLMVESYKLSLVLHVQDSPIPRSVLVRKWVQDFIEKVMRQTVAPVQCPAEPWMDFLVNEVSSRINTPALITRCDKSIQTDSPNLHYQTHWKDAHSGHYFAGAQPSSSPYIGWIHPSTWCQSIIVQPCVCFISYRGSPSKATSCFSLV
ncbi:uncharacterized protein TNCV_1251261 [Trichonephila clavipes]|nr:uncharacterized protein TNCV_1251261 [Trichonephila clavipes]